MGFRKQWNTVCISRFLNRTDGGKDKLPSRRRIVQSFLRFRVAAMAKPNVLIVDEALAVGDYKLQQKCMKRMRELLDGGTTLLFVSHNTQGFVRSRCLA